MAVTSEQVQKLGYSSLELYVKNNPVDQIGTERPFLKMLMAGKKTFPGAKQYIVEQIRTDYDSNLQWYYGDDQTTYNKKDTIRQCQFAWKGWHDGYSLHEDEMLSNGIVLTDGATSKGSIKATQLEGVALTQMFDENNETLMLGAKQKFDLDLLRDGSQDVDSVKGLDSLVSLTPASGETGGIPRTTQNSDGTFYWQNGAYTGLTTGAGSTNILDNMETGWRANSRNGGRPNFYMAGSNYIDAFKTAAKAEIARYTIVNTQGQAASFDPAIGNQDVVDTGLHFHGVPIYWNPVFEDLDVADSPATAWEDRCYSLNTKHMKLRPAQGHDMITRNPPRVYDRYAYYWGLTWKGALCANRLNCHSVFALA